MLTSTRRIARLSVLGLACLSVVSNHLWVGGQFTVVAGRSQMFITRFTF